MKEYKSVLPEFYLGKRETNFKKVKISSSMDAADYIRNFYHEDIEIYESFFMLILNRANTTVGYVKISQGGIAGTVADIAIIAKYAIDSLASAIIIAHNHPSGNGDPSDNDKRLTTSVANALKLFNINLLDHVILTKASYYSFADNGNM